MATLTMKELLEAGVHFGHQTKRWNPKMQKYIFGERNGIYIIDLQKTLKKFREAYAFVRDLAAGGGTVLFVGTKKQAQETVFEEAGRCGMFYVNHRWLGGTLTNFTTIRKSIARLKKLDEMSETGEYERLPKKEVSGWSASARSSRSALVGIKEMDRLPSAVFIIDPKKEKIAVEPRRSGWRSPSSPSSTPIAIRRGSTTPSPATTTRSAPSASSPRASPTPSSKGRGASRRRRRRPRTRPRGGGPAAVTEAEMQTPVGPARKEASRHGGRSAELVKELRDRTGAGVMDCKAALEASAGTSSGASSTCARRGSPTRPRRRTGTREDGVVGLVHPPGRQVRRPLEVNCETDFVARTDDFQQLVKDLAMQVAAANPLYVAREDVPGDVVEKEREIYREQMADQKKPPQVLDKIIEGKLEKFYTETCLLEQPFIKDATGKTEGEGPRGPGDAPRSGERVVVKRFARFQVGEALSRTWRRPDAAPGAAPAYRRIVLKLSGEALAGRQGYGIDPGILARVRRGDRARSSGLGVAGRASSSAAATSSAASRPSAGGHGPRHRRLHGHARHRDQCARAPGRAREGRACRPACCPPSRCARSPSRTSAGAPSATSRRAAS